MHINVGWADEFVQEVARRDLIELTATTSSSNNNNNILTS